MDYLVMEKALEKRETELLKEGDIRMNVEGWTMRRFDREIRSTRTSIDRDKMHRDDWTEALAIRQYLIRERRKIIPSKHRMWAQDLILRAVKRYKAMLKLEEQFEDTENDHYVFGDSNG